jgi:hypothetical protein
VQGLHYDAPGFTSCQYSNRLKCEAAPVPLCRSRAAAAGCEIAQSSNARPAFLCALFPIHSPVFSELHLRQWCDKLIPGYTSAAIGGACSCDRGFVIHYTTKPISGACEHRSTWFDSRSFTPVDFAERYIYGIAYRLQSRRPINISKLILMILLKNKSHSF